MRNLLLSFQNLVKEEKDEFYKNNWLHLMESLAKQLKDPKLFEKIIIKRLGKHNITTKIELAKVYMESGKPETALAHIEEISPDTQFMNREIDKLLLELYGKLEKKDKEIETAWRIFKRYHSISTLDTLLKVIGSERRDNVINNEVEIILKDGAFSVNDAIFLIETERYDAAEEYLLKRISMIDGQLYTSLLPIAKTLESNEYFLASSIIYRSLLESIMAKANSKIL